MESFLGCFISFGRENDVPFFKPYIWGEEYGICKSLQRLRYTDYGQDIILILFQFYVNPVQYLLEHLKDIENYRKNEKSIGIPIIVNDENFFSKSEVERFKFLKESILSKMDLLAEVVKRKKLDTDIALLKQDIANILR